MAEQIKGKISIVMMGATGAVGMEALKNLIQSDRISKLLLLGRRKVDLELPSFVTQQNVDVLDPNTYVALIKKSDCTICTLGVGEPSKMSKEDFIKIDKTAVLNFAKACKNAGVKHFQLLASVGIDAKSSSFYLRTKGELVEELKSLEFERLSIFMPSMILTPNNRYGILQGITLAIWPFINPLFIGKLKSFKGIKVSTLGQAMAINTFTNKQGFEELKYPDFLQLTDK